MFQGFKGPSIGPPLRSEKLASRTANVIFNQFIQVLNEFDGKNSPDTNNVGPILVLNSKYLLVNSNKIGLFLNVRLCI